jgi:nucleoside-diphosphate-sugar epimerase
MSMKILITGAAGNLGSILARSLLAHSAHSLRLMAFRRNPPKDIVVEGRSEVVRADLGVVETLRTAIAGVDAIVHVAGVLFKANPGRFLPVTNTEYFQNLTDVACECGVRKIILISFPHVEGRTTFDAPATGRLDGAPVSHHARTRLEEERYLFSKVRQPISLRVGMVYGRGILMIEGARWLAKHGLLGVWREPTQIHLISTEDFCAACIAAISRESASGIYHVGDDGRVTLQEFLSLACRHWGYGKPRVMPLGLIYAAAWLCEFYSLVTGSVAPLTRDFIDIGRVSYFGDTGRMRRELLPELKFRTLAEGLTTL